MNRLQVFLLAIVLTSLCTKGYCSDSAYHLKRNVVFSTFGGKENFGSINYERIFKNSRKLYWSYSVGVQPFNLSKKFSIPASINLFTKGLVHHVEIDLTATFYMDKYHPYNGGLKDDFNKQLYFTPFFCYRYQKSTGILLKGGAGPQLLFDPPSNNLSKFRTKLGFSAFASLGLSF